MVEMGDKKVILQSVDKILLIRIKMVGDVLLTTPAVHTLRKSFPNASITYLTGRWAKEVLLHNPDIDEILVYDRTLFQRMVTRTPYDLVINFDSGEPTEAITFLSGARYRIGLSPTKPAELKNINVYNIPPMELTLDADIIDSFLNLTKSLGLRSYSRKTRFYLTKEERDFAKTYFRKMKLNNPVLIGIHPGGHDLRSLWKTDKFAKLADQLIKNLASMVFIFQGPGEEPIATKVYKNIKERYQALIIPIWPLRKYASLVKRCKIFIAHDRGPMHISASLGVKTIGIFTSLQAPIWFPYKEKDGCSYIQKNNTKEITVEDVLQEVKRLLVLK